MASRLFFAVLFFLAVQSARAESVDREQAVKLSRQWLQNDGRRERNSLAQRLGEYRGDWQKVVAELASRQPKKSATGYLPERHFSLSALRKQHPDDLLYFVVPKKYQPDRPTGLIVFMHGGGATSSRRAPRSYMQFPDADDGEINSRLGSLFSATGMIAVGPSAPWDESTPLRWCVRDSEAYLADVILECKARFNIDPDRVFLMGHSMGGFGAYHHIQRSPDRFAGVVVSSGSWSLGYWPTIRGTPLAIFQGAHDARAGVRWHYTDVEYGRWTDKLLKRQDLDHEYFEHDGKHSVGYSKERIAAWFKAAGRLERDACSPHVTLASPVGFSRTYCFPVRHNRWLTLDEVATSESSGEIKYDELRSHSTGDFSSWRLEHRTSSRPGSTIDAVNEENNRIVVTTQNVKRFTVWLQPRMIDPDKKVQIVVNGRTQFNGRVEPSLATALESYQRRQDWGLVYPMKVELEAPRE